MITKTGRQASKLNIESIFLLYQKYKQREISDEDLKHLDAEVQRIIKSMDDVDKAARNLGYSVIQTLLAKKLQENAQKMAANAKFSASNKTDWMSAQKSFKGFQTDVMSYVKDEFGDEYMKYDQSDQALINDCFKIVGNTLDIVCDQIRTYQTKYRPVKSPDLPMVTANVHIGKDRTMTINVHNITRDLKNGLQKFTANFQLSMNDYIDLKNSRLSHQIEKLGKQLLISRIKTVIGDTNEKLLSEEREVLLKEAEQLEFQRILTTGLLNIVGDALIDVGSALMN